MIEHSLMKKGHDMSNLEEVLSEYQNNFEFKQQFKKNPEQALAAAGLTLNAVDLEKVKTLLKTKDGDSDGELDKRINK
jgi:hypothetical protein